MLKKAFLSLLLLLCCGGFARAEIATVNGALKMDIPYLQYSGTYYHLILDYCPSSPNPADPQGLYWKYNTIYPAASQPQTPETCASIDEHLTILIPYLYFMGYELSVTLTFYNPADSSGIYWKLAIDQVFPAFISAVKGPGDECLPDFSQITAADIQAFYAFQGCIAGCGGNVSCISACGQNLPAGLPNMTTFQLACQFNNSSSGNIQFIIPAGAYFNPPSSEFQPMLVIQDLLITVAPGLNWNCISTYCMDLGAGIPEATSIYAIGGIIDDECMKRVIETARGKALNSQDKGNLQDAIWDCKP